MKHVTQDDAHVFCTREQIPAEIDGCLDYLQLPLRTASASSRARSSRRDPTTSSARDEEWDFTEARARWPRWIGTGPDTSSAPGEGSFYGPKIDLHLTDVLGRSWQMGTIQLDSQMPAQFGLTYMGPDNREHEPSSSTGRCSARSSASSGSSIEHYGGAFPFWLSPVQARMIPGRRVHRGAAGALRDRLAAEGYRVEVDERDDTLGKRIRDAEIEKVPFVVVYGDRESDEALAVRGRGGEQSTVSLDVLLARFAELAAEADPG